MELRILDVSLWGFFRFHGADAKTFLPGVWEATCLDEHWHQIAVIATALRTYAEEARREERDLWEEHTCQECYDHIAGVRALGEQG